MNNDKLEPIEIKSIKVPRKQSIVVNNFFTIITISIMSIVIIWYVNFVLPEQKKNNDIFNKKEIEYKNLKKEQKLRQEQIDLSRKLNAKS